MDRLNNLKTQYPKIDLSEWFDEMDIPEADKRKRLELSEKIYDVFEWLFMMVLLTDTLNDVLDYDSLVEGVRRRLEDIVDIDIEYVAKHLESAIYEYVSVTLDHRDDDYYLSPQRASEIAADEAHTIETYGELEEAEESGYLYKVWKTMRDRKVRHTHAVLDDKKIPIDELFTVGNHKMICPKDTTNGADLREVAGCRCWLEYA